MEVRREDVDKLFERGTVSEVIPSIEDFKKYLSSGKDMHIYLGIDPTSDKLHLGHIQNILFLEDLRKLGVKVTLLFGTFTGLIGDPTGKETSREVLTRAKANKNTKTWKKQVKNIIKLGRGASINQNNKWFDKLSAEDVLNLLRETTVQHLLERDMFEKRMKKGDPLYANELMYPLFQGYDSVAMKVNAELCGTDQTFNALLGRTLVKRRLGIDKFVVAMKLIEGDGVMMAKSNNTGVFVDIEPGGEHRMFGSIMALSDSFVGPLLRGCTRIDIKEVERLESAKGVSARDAKLRLSEEIVKMFHGETKAKKARDSYITQFQKNEVPENVATHSIKDGQSILEVVEKIEKKSRSDIKRLIKDGAVSIDDKKVKDLDYSLQKKSQILKVGRNIYKLN